MSPHSTKRFHRELARMDDTTALLVNKAQLTILAANVPFWAILINCWRQRFARPGGHTLKYFPS